jgi:multicomponent Na+:H+ antiporter subunit B
VPAEPLALAQYLGSALAETGAPNRVAAIYLNYRMFDSLFETMMLLVCVLAVVRMSWRGNDPDEP